MNDLGRPQSMLSFDKFREYFDPFAPYLFEVYLHNWGESLLNPEIYRMAEYAQKMDVGTNLSSNFVQVDSRSIDNILDCGLEYLVVSLDGTCPATYLQYRVRGDFQRVIENLETLIRSRNRRHQRFPIVEWQFIVMKHNQHEMPAAQKMAKTIGVDLLRFIPAGMPLDIKNRSEIAARWFPAETQQSEKTKDGSRSGQAARKGPCFYLYRSMVINPDGGISPCCSVYRLNHDFADIRHCEGDPMTLWNNRNYRSARSLFSNRKTEHKCNTVCDSCDVFMKQSRVNGLATGRKPSA
jgi:MoaA/NifB/PqqE/SkfB family radical SAM enzyme